MSENFNKVTFPQIDYNIFINELTEKIDLNKSFPVSKLYVKKEDEYFFQDVEFIKAFNDFSGDGLSELTGVYIFSVFDTATKTYKPDYIGISRDLRRRMADHLIRKNKSSATWAYLLEVKRYRYNVMPLYEKHPDIANLYVYFHRFEKDRDFELHLAEILLVLHFKPYWNSFKTH